MYTRATQPKNYKRREHLRRWVNHSLITKQETENATQEIIDVI